MVHHVHHLLHPTNPYSFRPILDLCFLKTTSKKVYGPVYGGGFKPGVSDADIRVQNTRPVRNSRREGVADMVVSTDEQSANGLGVVNGTQLSDGSIGTAPHAPLETFLSSGNSGARTAHDLTHMQVLNPQPAYFPAALETKSQQGDKAYFPFKFEQTVLPPSSYGTEHVPVHYKTNDPQISDRSFSTMHLGSMRSVTLILRVSRLSSVKTLFENMLMQPKTLLFKMQNN